MAKKISAAILVCVGGLSVWYLSDLVSANLKIVGDLIADASVSLLAVSLLGFVFWWVWGLGLWSFVLSKSNIRPTTTHEVIMHAHAFAASLLARYVPGKIALTLVRTEVGIKVGAPRANVIAATAIEQMQLLTSSVAYSLPVVAFLGAPIRFGDDPEVLFTTYAISIAYLVLWLTLPVWSGRFIRRLPRRWQPRFDDFFPPVSLLRWSAGFLIATTLILIQVGAVFVCEEALVGSEIRWQQLLSCALLYPVARLLGQLVVMVPAGLGIREAAFVYLVGPWISTDNALAVAVLSRLLSVASELLMFGVTCCALWGIRLSQKKQKPKL